MLPIGSERVLLCAAEGAPIADARAATDLIGAASFLPNQQAGVT
ncbi:hypothetical protein ABIE09_002350 [Lysobacter enzymogenes]